MNENFTIIPFGEYTAEQVSLVMEQDAHTSAKLAVNLNSHGSDSLTLTLSYADGDDTPQLVVPLGTITSEGWTFFDIGPGLPINILVPDRFIVIATPNNSAPNTYGVFATLY